MLNADYMVSMNLLQAKIKTPTHLTEYSFIDEIIEHKKKMINMIKC